MIRNKNIKVGHIETDELLFLDPQYEHQHRNKRLMLGDVVVVRTGYPGTAAVVPAELENAQCFTSLIIRPNPALLDSEYLCAFINSDAGQRQFSACAAGGAQKNVNAATLSSMTIPVPPIPRQRTVVAVVRLLESQTRQIVQLIDGKRHLKRGIMQQLLTGQKRFPEFRTQPWKSSRLGDHVAQINRRNAHGLTLVLTASGEHGLVDQRTYFNRNVSGVDLSKYYHLKKGEFAYNRSAMNGYPYGATKRLDSCEEGVLSVLYLCFATTDSNLDSDFLKQVFDSGILNRQLRPIVRVGARAHGLLNVTDEDYLAINIPFPKIEEQQRIAAFLTALDRELELLAALRDQVELQKRGLLSRLLSGELQVPA